eukprot:scaffold78491_cov22-Tisochrysis_lutea.AAC.2
MQQRSLWPRTVSALVHLVISYCAQIALVHHASACSSSTSTGDVYLTVTYSALVHIASADKAVAAISSTEGPLHRCAAAAAAAAAVSVVAKHSASALANCTHTQSNPRLVSQSKVQGTEDALLQLAGQMVDLQNADCYDTMCGWAF